MAYGIEVKNKASQVLFSSQETQHVGLKKVMSGLAEVSYWESNEAMGSRKGLFQKIYLNGGATRDNALIFARPDMGKDLLSSIDNFSNASVHPSFSDTLNSTEDSSVLKRNINRAVQGFWPMAVHFGTDGIGDYFYIHGPDNSQNYYNGVRQSTNAPSLDPIKEFNNSQEHWDLRQVTEIGRDGVLNTENKAMGLAYYEIFIPNDNSSGQNIAGGFTDSDAVDSGLSIKDTTNKEIFNSNQEFFNIEQTGYNRFTFNDLGIISRLWFGRTGYRQRARIGPPSLDPNDIVPVRMYLKSKSNGAQLDYMACLNGTASHQAVIVGGRQNAADGSLEINANAITYFKSFVEFHYFDENNILGNRPYIAQVTRLSETQNYQSIGGLVYNFVDYVRTNDKLGVPTLSIIGKSA